jgi:hypothetical protein
MTFGTGSQFDVENGGGFAHVSNVTFKAKVAILVLCHVLYCLLAAPATSGF